MLNFSEYLEEDKRGLWDNIHAKRKRIKAGSGERMRKPGSKGAPTAADFKAANEEVVAEGSLEEMNRRGFLKGLVGAGTALAAGSAIAKGAKVITPHYDHAKKKKEREEQEKARPEQPGNYQQIPKPKPRDSYNSIPKESVEQGLVKDIKRLATGKTASADEQFDLIEDVIEQLAEENGIDSESIWETLESVDDIELLEYAIDKKGHKSSTGGLTQKGVDAYNAKTGGNLQTAVTTPPSKLKPGSKAANRRKSFCARMGGVKGPMKDDKGRPTRKALALRKWNC